LIIIDTITQRTMTQKTTTKFGIYGGQFVPEILMPAIEEFATRGFGCREEQFHCNTV